MNLQLRGTGNFFLKNIRAVDLVATSDSGQFLLVLQLIRADWGSYGWLADCTCYGLLTESLSKGNFKPYLLC